MTSHTETVVIRRDRAEDRRAVGLLAQLDSARAPEGPLLVAEVDGGLRAARSLEDGNTVAHPFFPTAGLVALLEVRAGQLAAAAARGEATGRREGNRRRPRLRRLRPAPAGRAG